MGVMALTHSSRRRPGQVRRCAAPQDKVPPMDPRNVELARQVCERVKDETLHRDCPFDVGTTGDPVFAEGAIVEAALQEEAKLP